MYQVLKVYFIEEEKEFFANFTHKEVEKYIKAYEKKEAAAIEEGIYVSTRRHKVLLNFFLSGSTTQETHWIYYLCGRRVRA